MLGLIVLFSVIITSLVLIIIDMIINIFHYRKLLKVVKKNNKIMNLNTYLRQDREFIVSKMNKTRETIEFCRREYRGIQSEIEQKQKDFANGISAKDADNLTDQYLDLKYAREDLAKELKHQKKEFSKYSRILSIIDNNLYLGV